jgi:cytosine/uracil/thiamine/allantoin permease
MIVDYFIVRKGNYKIEELLSKKGLYWYSNGFNWYGLGSWMAGAVIFVILRSNGFGINSIGAVLPGFFITAAIYYFAAKVAVSRGAYHEVIKDEKVG